MPLTVSDHRWAAVHAAGSRPGVRRTPRLAARSPRARPGPCEPGGVSQALYEVTVNALLDRDRPLTRGQWDGAAARVGADRAPLLLAELDDAGLLPPDLLPAAVRAAWDGADRPAGRLHPDRWAELFDAAGLPFPG